MWVKQLIPNIDEAINVTRKHLDDIPELERAVDNMVFVKMMIIELSQGGEDSDNQTEKNSSGSEGKGQ